MLAVPAWGFLCFDVLGVSIRGESGRAFLLDDGFGLYPVEKFSENGFDVFADVASDDEKEKIVTGPTLALDGFCEYAEYAGSRFKFAADGVHACPVGGDANRGDGCVVFARPASHDTVMYQNHAHVIGEPGFLFEFRESESDIQVDLQRCK